MKARSWILTACVLGSSMAYIDSSVVNIALPRMEADLAAPLTAMTWVINAYMLCMSALLLIGGAAADQTGRRRVFVTGICIFSLASVGCGIATTVGLLVLARGVQGVGAALLIPCSLAIIGATYSEKERGVAIGIWSGASAIAAGSAPLCGGWLVDHLSWRAIFLVNPFIALPTLAIILRHLPESTDIEARKGLDLTGTVLAFIGLGLLVYGLIEASNLGWQSPVVLGCILLSAVTLTLFVFAERRSPMPMMPLDIFASTAFRGVNILTLLLYGALAASLFFVPFLLIQVHGYSATAAGAAFLPFTIIMALLSKWGGGLVERFGARPPLVVGPIVVALGFALIGVPGTVGPYWSTFLPPMSLLGIGMAITVAPLTTTVLNSVPQHMNGVASGVNNAVTQMAGLLAIAILGTVSIGLLHRELDHNLAATAASQEVRASVNAARNGFVMPSFPKGMSEQAKGQARFIVAQSFASALRVIMFIAAGLALAGAACSAVSIRQLATTKK